MQRKYILLHPAIQACIGSAHLALTRGDRRVILTLMWIPLQCLCNCLPWRQPADITMQQLADSCPGHLSSRGRLGPRGTRPGSRAPPDRPRWPGSSGHLSSRGRKGPRGTRPGSRAPLDRPRWSGSPGHLNCRGRKGPRGTRPGSRALLDRPRWPGSSGHLSSRGRKGPRGTRPGSRAPLDRPRWSGTPWALPAVTPARAALGFGPS